MRAAAREIQRQLMSHDASLPADWRTFDWRARWNFPRSIDEAMAPAPSANPPSHDTVGVAVRAADGRFAVALSTGGTSITLRGRVGDVPVYGAGLFASPDGAVAATGSGERIIEQSLGRTVVGWLADGASSEDAARRAVALIGERGSIGVIVIGRSTMAAAADRDMAWAGRAQGSTEWLGPGL
jgi:isoaspartyl peptidase/L-asparaginase-like protein (Ntn-hydrolase superfamily)